MPATVNSAVGFMTFFSKHCGGDDSLVESLSDRLYPNLAFTNIESCAETKMGGLIFLMFLALFEKQSMKAKRLTNHLPLRRYFFILYLIRSKTHAYICCTPKLPQKWYKIF